MDGWRLEIDGEGIGRESRHFIPSLAADPFQSSVLLYSATRTYLAGERGRQR